MGTMLLVIICCFFSYSKIWEAYSTNRKLTNQLATTNISAEFSQNTQKKYEKIDSILKHYTQDSAVFETNFLTNVSQVIHGLPVELIYDERKTKQTQQSNIQSKSLLLTGDYRSVVRVIQKLEHDFFVSSVRYDTGDYWVELVN